MHSNFKCEFHSMDTDNVAIRLKGFIDSQKLSHSQFSDRCGIPRPSLSQILSGRNKKVSDVIIGQIHRAFPNLSILWLLFGEGPMLLPSGDGSGNSAATNAPSASAQPIGSQPLGSESGVGAGGVDVGVGLASAAPNVAIGVDGMSGLDFTISDDESGFPGGVFEFEGAGSTGVSGGEGVSVGGQSPVARNSASYASKNPANGPEGENFSNLRALNATSQALQRAKQQLVESENIIASLRNQIENLRKNPRKVTQITVYYDDSTFDTFFPRGEK